VLCTDRRTFDLKKVETSNMVLLVHKPVDQIFEAGQISIGSILPSHLEVHPFLTLLICKLAALEPDLLPLTKLIAQYRLNPEDEKPDLVRPVA
jgi:hypothetical protein